MSNGRRVNDRRRRVLYSANQPDHSSMTAARRNEVRRMREARRPQAAYGSRVHRRLRARWFSLVPVRRRSVMLVSGSLIATAIVIFFAHYAAVTWPSIAYRPELARPLRLDRPDSFGHCLMVALLTASTGVSLLIYQLRRYRNDDYKGHYRLWRLVMIVMALASVNAMVGMIDWSGAILDTLFGKRVALSGSDWIRLVVSLGGAVLAIRLIAEVRRCRSSLMLMIASCMALAIPEAAKWNVLTVDSLSRWVLVTSAPLLACTALFLSLLTYLRMLYREVRQILDSEPLLDRLRQLQGKWFGRSKRDEEDQEDHSRQAAKKEEDSSHRRRWWQRRDRSSTKKQTVQSSQREREYDDEEDDEDDAEENDSRETKSSARGNVGGKDSEVATSSKPKAKRRWFGLRRAKPPTDKNHDDVSTSDEAPGKQKPDPSPTPKKRSRFSLRLKPPNSSTSVATANQEQEQEQESETEQPSASPRKRGWGLGWLRRGKGGATKKEKPSSRDKASSQRQSSQTSHDESDQSEIDTDDIDWNSLNKSERRRLRKQLKRQNRAA